MKEKAKLLDVVALTEDLPAEGLVRGQVGTIVEEYTPEAFEVEFSDNDGRTYALASLSNRQFMVLHHEPVGASPADR